MKPPSEKQGQKRSSEKENENAKATPKLDDLEPANDVKGGRTNVKDSNDRYANT